MLGEHGIDIVAARALGREIAARAEAEVDHLRALGFGESGGAVNRRGLERGGKLGGAEIEGIGRERAVASPGLPGSAAPLLEIVADVGEAFLARRQRARIDHRDIAAAEIVEQRRQPLLEQGQPVFHPGQPPAFADRLVKRVLGGGGAEAFAVAQAEPLDAVLVEQRLACGQQEMAVERSGAHLRGRIERAQGFDLVAEEIEPKPLLEPAGKDVDDRAPDRELAGVDHGVGAAISLPAQQRGEAVEADAHARPELAHRLAHPERGQHALGQRVDRGHEELRRGGFGLQPVKRGEPARADRQRRAGAIVGQAIPRRKLERFELGREIARRIGDRAHRRVVGCDQDRARAAALPGRARQIRHQQWLRASCNRRQGERRCRFQDAGEIGHWVPPSVANTREKPARAVRAGIGKVHLGRCRQSATRAGASSLVMWRRAVIGPPLPSRAALRGNGACRAAF